METIILIAGAYLLWRMVSERGKPSQLPSPDVQPQPQEEPQEELYIEQRKASMVLRFEPIIGDAAESLNIPADILKALIYLKSGGDDGARIIQNDSEYGYGLTQITCSRARSLAHYEGIEGVSEITDCTALDDPINSIWYGANYLRLLYRGDWQYALSMYYSPTESLIPREDAVELARQTLAVANEFAKMSK